MTLIQQIQEATAPIDDTPEGLKKTKALDPYYNKIEDAISTEFANEFYRLNAEAWSVEVDEAFVRGLRVGGQLMLAVVSGQEAIP